MERGAGGQCGVGVDGAVAGFNEADDALFVDDDVGPQGPLVGFVLDVVALEDAVGGKHLVVHVAEKREIDVDLLGEGSICSGTIHANAEDCGICGVDLTRGDSSLDRLKLFRSTAGKCQDVDGEKDVPLAAIVAELHTLPLIAKQGEVRCHVTHFQRHLCHFWLLHLLRQGRSHRRSGQQYQQSQCTFHSHLPWG